MECVAISDSGLLACPGALPPVEVIFGRSAAMGVLRKKVEKAAAAHIPVLLQGASGTGKEILARFIHRHSPWGNGPFVKVNCPAIPSMLLESELFGYERGAFTGAHGTKPGRIERAHQGTLFLDEIAELDYALQAKLLQLLQDGHFCRIGAQQEKRVEIRVICATNRQLQQEVLSGSFREDLFYRINVVTIHLPLLRERGEDIPMLVKYFWDTHCKQFGSWARPLSSRCLENLTRYHWPGNIRELENLIKRYVILGSEDEINVTLHSSNPDDSTPEVSGECALSLKDIVRQAVRQLERKMIFRTLELNHWNRRLAARSLGISYAALLYKLREAGVPPLRGPRAEHKVRAELE